MIKATINIQNRTANAFPSNVNIKTKALLVKSFETEKEFVDYLKQENLTLVENFTNFKFDIDAF